MVTSLGLIDPTFVQPSQVVQPVGSSQTTTPGKSWLISWSWFCAMASDEVPKWPEFLYCPQMGSHKPCTISCTVQLFFWQTWKSTRYDKITHRLFEGSALSNTVVWIVLDFALSSFVWKLPEASCYDVTCFLGEQREQEYNICSMSSQWHHLKNTVFLLMDQ